MPQGPFDAVFVDEIGGDLRPTLLSAALQLKPGEFSHMSRDLSLSVTRFSPKRDHVRLIAAHLSNSPACKPLKPTPFLQGAAWP
jgi:hypothetical protein